MKDLSTDACHLDENPKPLQDALKDFMFSSAPLETYVVQPSDERPSHEIGIFHTEDWTIIQTPGLNRQAVIETKLKTLGGPDGVEAEGRTEIKLTFEALQRAAGFEVLSEVDPEFTEISRINAPADSNE